MFAAQITVSVLVNVTLGRVNVLAPNAEEWRYRIMTAEAHGRETVVGNARDSQLRSEFGVIGDVVLVLKTVVPHGEFIDAAAADRPGVGNAHLGSAHNLPLDRVNWLSGEGQESPAAVPVVPVSVIPGKGPPQLLLAGKHVIDFGGVCVA